MINDLKKIQVKTSKCLLFKTFLTKKFIKLKINKRTMALKISNIFKV